MSFWNRNKLSLSYVTIEKPSEKYLTGFLPCDLVKLIAKYCDYKTFINISKYVDLRFVEEDAIEYNFLKTLLNFHFGCNVTVFLDYLYSMKTKNKERLARKLTQFSLTECDNLISPFLEHTI